MAKGSSNGGTAATLPAHQVQGKPPASTAKAVGTMLEASMNRLAAVLPKHLTPARVVQVVSSLVYRNPRLQECDRNSIFTAVIRASSLGLDLEQSANEAHLVPRWNSRIERTDGGSGGYECHFQPGYQGLRKLAMRSGHYALIESRLVYEGDVFTYSYEPDLTFHHSPTLFDDRRGAVVCAYAIAKLTNGERQIKVLTISEIEENHHRRSEGYRTAQRKQKAEEGPWVTDWPEMARKSALIALCKDLEKSHELIDALAAEVELHRSDDLAPVTLRPADYPSRSAALAVSLGPPAEEPEFREGTGGVIGVEADEGDTVAASEPGSEG